MREYGYCGYRKCLLKFIRMDTTKNEGRIPRLLASLHVGCLVKIQTLMA